MIGFGRHTHFSVFKAGRSGSVCFLFFTDFVCVWSRSFLPANKVLLHSALKTPGDFFDLWNLLDQLRKEKSFIRQYQVVQLRQTTVETCSSRLLKPRNTSDAGSPAECKKNKDSRTESTEQSLCLTDPESEGADVSFLTSLKPSPEGVVTLWLALRGKPTSCSHSVIRSQSPHLQQVTWIHWCPSRGTLTFS